MLIQTLTHLVVLAQAPMPDATDSASWMLQVVKWALEQFQQKNYMPAASGLLMLAIGLFQKFELTRLPKLAVPFVSAGLGVLGACAMNLTALALGSKPHDWLTAVLMGLTVGAGASGFWELIGQKALGKLLGNQAASDLADDALKLAAPAAAAVADPTKKA